MYFKTFTVNCTITTIAMALKISFVSNGKRFFVTTFNNSTWSATAIKNWIEIRMKVKKATYRSDKIVRYRVYRPHRISQSEKIVETVFFGCWFDAVKHFIDDVKLYESIYTNRICYPDSINDSAMREFTSDSDLKQKKKC